MQQSVMTANGLRTLLLLARRDCRHMGPEALAEHRRRAETAPPAWAAWVLLVATGEARPKWRPGDCVEILLLSYGLEVDSDHVDWLRRQEQG